MNEVYARKIYRIGFLLTIAVCFFGICLATIAYAQSQDTTGKDKASQTGIVKVRSNIHAEPRINAPILRKTSAGDSVTIIGRNENGSWLQIDEAEWIPAMLVRVNASALGTERAKTQDDTSANEPITQTRPVADTAATTRPKVLSLGSLLQERSANSTATSTSNEELSDVVTSTRAISTMQEAVVTSATIVVTRQIGVVNQRSNLRAGPAVTFGVVRQANEGEELEVVQSDESESWFEVESESDVNVETWIAAYLVDITGQISFMIPTSITDSKSITTNTSISKAAIVTTTEIITKTTPKPIALSREPAYAIRSANLRAGPGTNFDIAGGVAEGAPLEITGRNRDESWYYLQSGNWIAAFLVADVPPTPTPVLVPEPTPFVEQAPEPETALAPISNGNEFVVVEKRLWDVNENGGHLDGPSVHCGYKRELHVHVLDRNGGRMNGVQVQAVYGAKEIMVTGSQGIGDGVASFVLGKGQDVKIVRAPDGREVTSEIARGLVTEPQYIDPMVLQAGRYCTDAGSCRAFIDGNSCFGHYSWTVTFQQQ